MRGKILITLIVLFLLVLTLILLRGSEGGWICQDGQWVKHGQPTSPPPSSGCGEKQIKSFQDCVALGYPILESYPRQCKTPDGRIFTEDIGNELEKADLIRVSSPRPGQALQNPFVIEGEARGFWFFEGDFPFKLLDENNNIVAQGVIQAKSDWMTEDFVPFEAEVSFNSPKSERGVLILEKDNPSGLPENADSLIIPILFGKSNKKTTVKVYFSNNNLDPELSCNKVFPVEREIPKTQAVARAALEELLKGPTEEEKTEGFFTNIGSGVKVQKLIIENNVAKVDFDEQLEFQVGGSCRVTAIRAQITETLKQFPNVKEVVISINGRTEDILQP